MLVRVTPIRDAQGAIIGAVEVFSDISPQKVVQEELERMRALALLDPLTGIGNRRFIESNTYSLLEELRRYGWSFGVILIDIDHFKAVNDTFGHLVGDEILKMVARTLLHNIRTFDIVGRWGGEEFVVIARNVDSALLRSLAERLRILVEKSSLPVANEVVYVTISMGAALARWNDTPVTLLDRADQMLYLSKQSGRNRVSVKEDSSVLV
ncbi:MAG: GGDEF domain-containing protein [Roseiflexus sp.]